MPLKFKRNGTEHSPHSISLGDIRTKEVPEKSVQTKPESSIVSKTAQKTLKVLLVNTFCSAMHCQ